MNLDALIPNPDRHPEVRIGMGRKKDKGFGVVDKGRFWLNHFHANGSGVKARAIPHPAFAAFNINLRERHGLSGEALTHANRHFRTLYGNLIHADWRTPERFGNGACYTRFEAQQLPSGHPRSGRPACIGNGYTAQRYDRQIDAYREIECPADACEFRQEQIDRKGNASTACKRKSSIVFQLRWPDADCPECKGRMPAVQSCGHCNGTGKTPRDFPSATAMIATGGTWSYATMQWDGFYQEIRRQYVAMGGEGEPNLHGLPIRITLERKTVPSRRAEVWVPSLYVDLPPGQTIQGWLVHRKQMRTLLGDELAGQRLLTGPAVMGAEAAADAVYDAEDIEAEVVGYEMGGLP